MTDVVRGAPSRVPPEFPAVFEVPPGAFEPGRVPLPPTPDAAVRHVSRVRPQDLDPMGHVNNAAYLDYLEEALAVAGDGARPAITGTPRRIRLEYLLPAAPGSGLVGETWPEDVRRRSVLGVAPDRRRRSRAGPGTGAPPGGLTGSPRA